MSVNARVRVPEWTRAFHFLGDVPGSSSITRISGSSAVNVPRSCQTLSKGLPISGPPAAGGAPPPPPRGQRLWPARAAVLGVRCYVTVVHLHVPDGY